MKSRYQGGHLTETRRSWLSRMCLVSCLAVVATPALAQTNFPEAEPNDSRAAANLVGGSGMVSGDTITGSTTTASGTGIDYFRVKIASMTPAPNAAPIWRNRLTTVNSGGTTSNYGVSLYGLNQSSASSLLYTSGTTPDRFVQWYGFGKGEEITYRVTGATTTAGTYTSTLSSTPVTPLSTTRSFNQGMITVSSIGQTSVDTDFWVYNASGEPEPGFGNNNPAFVDGNANSGSPAWGQKVLTPGVYYVAMSSNNLANDQPNPANERTLTSNTTEGPNWLVNSVTTVNQNVSFTITDSAGYSEIITANKEGPYDVVFVKFEVVPPPPITLTPASSINPVQAGVSAPVISVAIATDPSYTDTITNVSVDLSAVSGSATQQLFDNGTNGDAVADDGVYSFQYPIPAMDPGQRLLTFTVNDSAGRNVARTLTLTVAMPNDDCASAEVITGFPLAFSDTALINVATSDAQIPSCSTAANNSIWYTYTPTSSGLLSMRETGPRDIAFALYTGVCGSLTQVMCEGTETDANAFVQAGVTYFIQAYTPGTASASGTDTYVLSITNNTPPPAPANDACATATDLLAGTLPRVETVVIGGAQHDADIDCNATYLGAAANGIWYKFTTNQRALIEIYESDPNTIGYYTIYDTCSGGTPLDCRTMGTSAVSRTYSTVDPAGVTKTYYVLISRDRYAGAAADFDLTINLMIDPFKNHVCEGAVEITSFPFTDTRYNFESSNTVLTNCGITANFGVWYKYTATKHAIISVREIAAYTENDGALSGIVAFSVPTATANQCTNLTDFWCVPGLHTESDAVLRLEPGNTYYFVAYRTGGGVTATSQLTFWAADISIATPPPANDLCQNARPVNFTPYVETIYPMGATADFIPQCVSPTARSGASAQIAGVWYRYTNATTNVLTGAIQTYPPNDSPSTGKAAVVVYENTCPTANDAPNVGCSYNVSNPDYVEFTMQPGQTYYFMISGGSFLQQRSGTADDFIPFRFDVVDPANLSTPLHSTCSTAKVIPALPYRDVTFSYNLPTDFVASVDCSFFAGTIYNATWYTYTTGPSATGYLVYREASIQDAIIALWQGDCPSNGGTQLRCTHIGDIGMVQITPNTTYSFLVGRRANTNSTPGETYDFQLEVVQAPTNDVCSGAKTITTLPYEDITIMQTGAGDAASRLVTPDVLTLPSLSNDCATITSSTSYTVKYGVWYRIVARDNFSIVGAEQFNSAFRARWFLYEVDPANECDMTRWTPIDCSTGSSTGTSFSPLPITSLSALPMQAGKTYYLLLGGPSSTELSFTDVNRSFTHTILHSQGSDVGRCSVGRTCETQTKHNCLTLGGTFTPGTGPCRADFSCSSGLNIDDIFIFLNAWFAGDTRTDWDLNGVVNIDDIFIYLNAWFAGCPA